MLAKEIRQRFIDFFVKKHQHKEMKSASVIPDNDPTVLFTTAGMHPLVPYLMGEKHPLGTRLVDAQKCIRTDDIDEVGDSTHCTFFEMLGNWSLGDYFKKEAIEWSYEFLTSLKTEGGLELDPKRLMVSCFEGDKDASKDEEAAMVWESLGFIRAENAKPEDKKLIFFYGKKNNWWGPAGQTGPCGPDTEMFYDTCPDLAYNEHKSGVSSEQISKSALKDGSGRCHPDCNCGRFVEIWNDVFMQYQKNADGTFEPLQQKNVDTGMGLERVTAILQGVSSHYETELFVPLKEKIIALATGEHNDSEADHQASIRIISDHIRAATFIMGDSAGISPSNTDQGYILRRLIRRAIRHGKMVGITEHFTHILGEMVVQMYGDAYPELERNKDRIISEFKREEEKFQRTLENGIKEMRKIWCMDENEKEKEKDVPVTEGDKAFFVYETYGFPIEMIEEELKKNGYTIDTDFFRAKFNEAMKGHQDKSRAGSEQKFAGGLADHSDECKKLHTATHLLHQAMKTILGPEVEQRGSNITAERMRFDFNYPQKLTPDQIKALEELVNVQIERKLPISYEILSVEEAKKRGAIGLFEDKYSDQVKVYKMGDFSFEICGGPHADNTGDLKKFKISKEEACSAGIRRIKAVIGDAAMK